MRISDWSSDVCSSDLVARLQRIAMPVARESIARFTDRADDVGGHIFAGGLYRDEIVPRAIERRAGEIVHRRIDDHERWAVSAALHTHDTRQQYPSVAPGIGRAHV